MNHTCDIVDHQKHRFPGSWKLIIYDVDVIKLGKQGQVSIPKGVLTELGLAGEQLLLVETTPDGSILLRPTGVYPLESYSDARIAAFLAEDQLTDTEAAHLQTKLGTP